MANMLIWLEEIKMESLKLNNLFILKLILYMEQWVMMENIWSLGIINKSKFSLENIKNDKKNKIYKF